MRSRLLGAAVASGVLVAMAGGMSACGDDDAGSPQDTLPPILTLPTTVPTTVGPSTTAPRYYEVQRGDTLFNIADAFSLPIPAIMELNGIEDQNDIQAGQILELPSRSIVATSLPAPAATTTSTSTSTTPSAP